MGSGCNRKSEAVTAAAGRGFPAPAWAGGQRAAGFGGFPPEGGPEERQGQQQTQRDHFDGTIGQLAAADDVDAEAGEEQAGQDGVHGHWSRELDVPRRRWGWW